MEEVLKLALIHDDEELKTGDRPSPDKEDSSYDMPTIEHGLVKVADRLEAYMYVREEIHLGNKFMQPFMPPTRSRYVKVRDHFMNLYKVSIGLRDVGLEHD
jgi:5'-deoxynucleotidase YfbR-like HD superfamily hydrolase